jgi:ABC-type glycerol-3-phosphate transport system substrate-binding protein
MKWTMMAVTLAAYLTAPVATAVADTIELQWWHAMTSVNADRVNKIAADFNASQDAYKIVPVFKGSYAETMNAGVAAYRAGNAPHIIQIFEVGTATMIERVSSGGDCLLQHSRRQDAVATVQQLYGDHLLEQGCLQEGGARPG